MPRGRSQTPFACCRRRPSAVRRRRVRSEESLRSFLRSIPPTDAVPLRSQSPRTSLNHREYRPRRPRHFRDFRPYSRMFAVLEGNRGGRIRTGDPRTPNAVRYQASPRPAVTSESTATRSKPAGASASVSTTRTCRTPSRECHARCSTCAIRIELGSTISSPDQNSRSSSKSWSARYWIETSGALLDKLRIE